MKIVLIGSSGKMGKAVCECAKEKHEIVSIDRSKSNDFFQRNEKAGDVLIDFSTSDITDKICEYAKTTRTPVVIGTTGQNSIQLEKIYELSKDIPVFLSGNMSMGISLFVKHLKEIIRFYPNAEVDIIETHHTNKKDIPSGTAILLAKAVQSVNHGKIIIGSPRKREVNDIHVLSRRMGQIVGEHTVVIYTANEVFTLCHCAQSRSIFAEGALLASEFIVKKQNGLYSIQDLLEEK